MTETPLSFLVIEDDPIDAHSVRHLIGKTGLGPHVDSAFSMEQAKQKIRNTRYDVVILDLGLPDSQGVDGIIDFQATAPELPIIVLTGIQDEQIALRGIDIGAEDFIDKNYVTAEGLSRSIRFAIRRHARKQHVYGEVAALRQSLDDEKLRVFNETQGKSGPVLPFSEKQMVQATSQVTSLSDDKCLGNYLAYGIGSAQILEQSVAISIARKENRLGETTLHCMQRAAEWRQSEASGSVLHLNIEADAVSPHLCSELHRIFKREEERANCILFFHSAFYGQMGGLSPADLRLLRQSGFQIGARKVGDGTTILENLQLLSPEWIRFDSVLTNHVSRYKQKADTLGETMDMLRPLGAKWIAEETVAPDDLRQLRDFGFSCYYSIASIAKVADQAIQKGSHVLGPLT